MDIKYQHLYSINEKFTPYKWGGKNDDNKYRKILSTAPPTHYIGNNFIVTNKINNYIDIKNIVNMHDKLMESLKLNQTIKAYTFDIETLGSFNEGANNEELGVANITEFGLKSMDLEYDGKNVTDSNYKTVSRLTFGLDTDQIENAQKILRKYTSILNGEAPKGEKMTDTELSTLKFLTKYGGEDVNIKNLKNKDGKYFAIRNDRVVVLDHFVSPNEIDVDRVKSGIRNLGVINSNQGIHTEVGEGMFDELVDIIGSIEKEKSILHGYNIHNYDIPFLQNFIDVTGKKINGKNYTSNINFKNLNTYDVYEVLQMVVGNDLVRETVKIAKLNGADIKLDGLGTLSTQSIARSVEEFTAHIALEDAPGTTKTFYKILEDDTSLFSKMNDFIENFKDKNNVSFISPQDKNKVLKAKTSLWIDQQDAKNRGLSSGKYDQHLVMDINGDYNSVGYFSFSVNSNNYYTLDSIDAIHKEYLDKEFPTVKFDFKDDSPYVYRINLTNASDLKNNKAIIFRENLEEVQQVINNFEVYNLVDEIEDKTLNQVTKEQINATTKNKSIDNARRKLDSTRKPKENGYDARFKPEARTSVRRYNLAFEKINNAFSDGKELIDKAGFDKIFSSSLENADIITNILGETFDQKASEIETFLTSFDYIRDNYILNKKVLNVIKANTINNFTDDQAMYYHETKLYDKIMSEIENKVVSYNEDLAKLAEEDTEGVAKKVLNYVDINEDIKDLKAIDLLMPINVNSNKKDFYNKPLEDRYFRASGTHSSQVASSIRNRVNSITKNSPVRLTEIQQMNKKKSYVKAMVKDLKKRGVINKRTYNEYLNYLKLAETNNGMNRIYNQLGNDLIRVIDNKNVKSKAYKGLTVRDIKVKDVTHNKINGMSYSDYVADVILQDEDIESFANNVIKEYNAHSNVRYVINSNKDNEPSFDKSGIGTWLKEEYGWQDKHVEVLKNKLYGSDGLASYKNGQGHNKTVTFFTMKDRDGKHIPLIGFSNPEQTIEFKDNKLPENMMYMFLPKLETDNLLYDYKAKKAVPGIVRLGNMQKINISRVQTYVNKIDSNNPLRVTTKDLVTRSLDTLTILKKDIIEGLETGNYNAVSSKLNAHTKRTIMNEKGVAQKTVVDVDGIKKAVYTVTRQDVDNLNSVIADDLLKLIPALYNADSSTGIDFRESINKAFGEKKAKEMIDSYDSRSITKLAKNNNLEFDKLPANFSNWLLLNMFNESKVDENTKEIVQYNGLLKNAELYFGKITQDEHSREIIEYIRKNGHTYLKDSNMTSLLISMSEGIKSTPLAQITDPTRPVMNQSQNAIPIHLDKIDYKSYEDELGITFGRILNTETALETYENVMFKNGTPISTSFVGDIKQISTNQAYKLYRDAMIDLDNDDLQVGDKILENINRKFNTDYTRKDLNEALEIFTRRTSTYEGAGLFNPRMIGMLNSELVYNMEVSEDFFNSVTEGAIVSKNQELGFSRKGQKLIHRKPDALILGKEIYGFDDGDILDKEKKFILSYKFNNPTNENIIKLSTFGGNEKGAYTTVTLNGKQDLAIGIFEELFGDVVAINQVEWAKHGSYGGIVGSYWNTIIDSALKYDELNETQELENFVSLLNKEFPEMKYNIGYDSNTGMKIVTHLSPNYLEKGSVTKNPLLATKNILNYYAESDSEFANIITETIEYMDKNMIFKTDISQLYLTDSYADQVKINDKSIRHMNMATNENIVKKSRLQHRHNIASGSKYKETDQLLQNIYVALKRAKGENVGVVEDLDVKNFHFTGAEPTYLDIKKSKVFNFNRTNKTGARINAYRVVLPEGLAYYNNYTEEISNEVYFAVNKSHHVNANEALSELQRAQENLIAGINKYYSNPNDIDNIKNIERLANDIYTKTQYTIFNKSGELAENMLGIKYKEGSMEVMTKEQAPDFIYELNGETLYDAPLDEKGKLIEGAKIKGFVDKSYDKDLLFKDGELIGVKENYRYSELALNDKGIYFDVIGEDILERGTKVEKEFSSSIINAKKDLEVAKEVLTNAIEEANEELIENAEESIRSIYYNLGSQYMEEIGIYGGVLRHPTFKDTSYTTGKILYDPVLTGKEVATNFLWKTNKAGDVDTDQAASHIYTKDIDGTLHLLSIDDARYKDAEEAYLHMATNNNMENLIPTIEGHYKDLRSKDMFYQGMNESPLDIAYEKSLELDKDLQSNFNMYENEFIQDKSMQARGMKNAVPEVSVSNNSLKQVMEVVWGANPDDYRVKDIKAIADLTEQRIISTKHIKSKSAAKQIVPVVQYTEGLKLMTSYSKEKQSEGFELILDVFNSLNLFGDEFSLVKADDITGGTQYSNLPTDLHRQLYTLNELFTDPKAKNTFGKVILNTENTKDGLSLLKSAFSKDAEFIDTESTQSLKYILDQATNLSYLDLNGNQLGEGAIIQADGYEPYKILSLEKNNREGFSAVELEDLHSGETTKIVGKTFSDISEKLNDLGFDYTDSPDISFIEPEEYFDRRFASYDDFVRETIIEDSVGQFTNKQMNQDRYAFYEALQEQFDKYELNEKQIKLIEEDIKNLTTEQKDYYRKSFANKTKDVYFETENLVNELRLTKTMTPREVLEQTKNYYYSTSADLIDEMNNDIRRKAIEENSRKVYENNINSQHYSNLDSYISTYRKKSKNNPIGFTGTTNISTSRKGSLINEKLNNLTFEQLGDMSITYNGEDIKVSAMNIEDVIEIAVGNTEKSKNVSRETIDVVQHYLGKIDLQDSTQSEILLGNKLSNITINTVQQAQNTAIKEMAKEVTNSKSNKLLSKTFDYVKNNKMKSAIIAGATVGLASAIVGRVNKPSPLIATNQSKEEIDERYATRESIRDIAPKTNKTVIVQPPRTTKGVSYKVSTYNGGKSDNNSLLNSLKGLMGKDSNLRYREEREEREINESWLKEKISDIF